jgi:hypothetical protein
MTARYPLLFGFREVVLCNGFIAGVSVADARALVEEEAPGQWWISGVNPGALADGGASFSEAIQNFCARFRMVLADYAAEAKEFSTFSEAATAFFHASDAETLAEWEAARADVRSGKATIGDLPHDGSNRSPKMEVQLLRLQPADNLRATSQAGMTALAA